MVAPNHDAAALAEIAASLARETGARIRSLRARGVTIAATKSSLVDVVTEADREAERMLAAGLREARPDDGLLGEEGTSTVGTSGITWVVDPIDGTVNYLYGLHSYAVSVAATVSGEPIPEHVEGNGILAPAASPASLSSASAPGATADGRRAVAGAVYLPASDELFTAFEGGGAFLNGRPLRVSGETELSTALVGTGFGYTIERRTEQAEIVRQIIPRVRDIRRIGAAAPDLCAVAAGRLDAYYERGLQPWDYAAGALIAREAGALILGLHDETLPGEAMLIAGPPELARALQAAVREAYATLH